MKLASAIRFGPRTGPVPKRKCEIVTDPDFFESYTKQPRARSDEDSPMIFTEFLLARTVPSEPTP